MGWPQRPGTPRVYMRIAATCTDCGFENPRAWVTCARCGALLGPRLRRGTGSGVTPDSQTTATALRPDAPQQAAEPAPAPDHDADGDADEKTRVYAAPAAQPAAIISAGSPAPAGPPHAG